jgi:hypothetical protein
VLAVAPPAIVNWTKKREITERIKKKTEYEVKGKSSNCPFCLGEKKKQGGVPISI